MTEQNQEAENWRGILWAMLSVIGASAMAISVRGASLGLDTRLLVGYRLFFTLILIGILILIVPRLRSKVHFKQPRAHLIRGILMAFSVHLGFYTLSIVPLAAAAILFATAPIFATIISVAMGRETIGIRRTLAILVGFIGTIIVMRPSSEIIDTNMIYGIGSSIFFSFSLVMSRNLARTDGPLSTLISTSAIGLIVTIPLAAPVFEITTDTNIILWTLVLIIFGILRQYSDIQAYTYAQAAVIAPISYFRVVLIGLMAYLFFNEIPVVTTYIGATIIIAATIYITNRERLAKN
ncbi:DMT family transporter [Amylibacter sp.]|mgnify:FL=1|nr:DMT family transporter [Rhodobacterales bacterium]MCO4796318.1 DMT family transporter [Amylibacter sp.]MBT4133504.1 DMT family transporter [Rhodobacterales bacterium]MBT4471351.1 DMT family transporter [Rhodobacterales bacterium]MBT7560721.1 DMT family transporter [Rhodobacterales bacterium]